MTSKTELYNIALKTIHPLKLKQFGESGHVSCALESINGNIFTGVCIDLPCALGFCAEQAAIAEMLKIGETVIKQIITVDLDGNVLPPCGRCREFIMQLDNKNINTMIIIDRNSQVKLCELLPEGWDKKYD